MKEERQVRRARLTEQEGCALLKARFEAAGYPVTENVAFAEEGVEVVLDGYDPATKVGYEFITTSAGDRAEFTPEVVGKLEAAIRSGRLFLLLVDEGDVDADGLSLAAERFLAAVKSRRDGAQ